jgi:hypothetical protein
MTKGLLQGDLEYTMGLISQVIEGDDGKVLPTEIAQFLGNRKNLYLLVKALTARIGREGFNELITLAQNYLLMLGDTTVDEICKAFSIIRTPEVRRLFWVVLSKHVKKHPKPIAALTAEPETRIIQEALDLLALEPEGTPARAQIERIAKQHKTRKRGQMAQETLDIITGEKERRDLITAMASSESKFDRMLATNKLTKLGNLKTFEATAKLVQRASFALRDEDEIERVFTLLIELGGLRSVRVLQMMKEVGEGGGLIFSRKTPEEKKLNRAAEACLTRYKESREQEP